MQFRTYIYVCAFLTSFYKSKDRDAHVLTQLSRKHYLLYTWHRASQFIARNWKEVRKEGRSEKRTIRFLLKVFKLVLQLGQISFFRATVRSRSRKISIDRHNVYSISIYNYRITSHWYSRGLIRHRRIRWWISVVMAWNNFNIIYPYTACVLEKVRIVSSRLNLISRALS